MSTLTLDKTKCWFGIADDDGKVHVYHWTHRLCDSQPTGAAQPVVTSTNRACCMKCIEHLNTATHSDKGAHYGGR